MLRLVGGNEMGFLLKKLKLKMNTGWKCKKKKRIQFFYDEVIEISIQSY